MNGFISGLSGHYDCGYCPDPFAGLRADRNSVRILFAMDTARSNHYDGTEASYDSNQKQG